MKDILGTALLDYQQGNYTEDLITETNISEEDELPLPYLFRNYDAMPLLEQDALKLTKGRVLDVGSGAGGHSLYLQEKGLEVVAIDVSEGAVIVSGMRGVKDARVMSLLEFTGERFDTILLLMNGTGIFQEMELVPQYLQHQKRILNPNGQVLIDSSDLKYMYDTNEDGSIWVPANRYYGELEFTMSYKGETTTPFLWLYLDEGRFEALAKENGFDFEVISRGENHDYLARLTALEHNRS